MAGLNKTPVFDLKAVLKETGLKAETVRAWERRYSLLQPHRSNVGQRLYSEYDIEILKWLIARQAEGMSIDEAAKLWHRLIENGEESVEQVQISRQTLDTLQVEPGTTVSHQRAAWIAACLAFDEQSAEHILNQAFASYLPEMVCFGVLQMGLAEIGDAWARDEATVSQEHFASALATRWLHTLISATPAPTRPNRILLACPPSEEHTFSLLLITFVLKRSGWDVLFLGANVPIESMQATIARAHPDLALLAAQSLPTAAALADMAEEIARCSVNVAFGGRIFNIAPEIRQQITGLFLAETLDSVPVAVERLLRRGNVTMDTPVSPPNYKTALGEYRLARPLIEADVMGDSAKSGIPSSQMLGANHFLGRDIEAALRLGDITLLDIELQWLAPVLTTRHVLADQLQWYLEKYLHCASAHLTPEHPLMSWHQADQ